MGSGAASSLDRISGSATSNFLSGALVAATRLGSTGRTSVGVEFERLAGNGSLSNTNVVAGRPSTETLRATSDISQTRITAGLSHAIGGVHTLGIFYRHAFIDARDADTSHLLDTFRLPLESTRSAGHSAEFGIRLRGPLTTRWFYGIDGSLIGLSLDDALVRTGAPNSHQRDRARRGAAGFGVRVLLTPRVILSFDGAGGSSRLSA